MACAPTSRWACSARHGTASSSIIRSFPRRAIRLPVRPTGSELARTSAADRSRCWRRVSVRRSGASCTSMPRGPASGARTAGSNSCGWAMWRPRVRARALEGVSITNAPFVRPSLIGSLRYGGALEPGWSVEAYRGGDLVAYDSADASGAFRIDLPVRYGENPVDFVAYGPFGEIREFNRTYRVLNELLPARRFEYGLSAGRCPQPSFICNATTNLDLRYGATARWTVQGGLDQYWRDSLADRTHPYAALVGNPSNDWAIQSEVVGAGLVRGALRYEPSVDLRLEGEYVHFTRDSTSVLAVPGRRAQWTLTGFFRPKTSHGFFFFDGRFERISTDPGALTRTRLGASIQTDEMRLLPYVRTEHGQTTTGPSGVNNREYAG